MFKDLVFKNKTYRRFFQDQIIPYQLMVEWVELARLVPNAKNQQALKYLIVNDPELNAQIFPHLRWAGYLKDWDGPAEGERPSAYIAIMIDKTISKNYLADWTFIDLGIAIQTILLAAAEQGYGGCVIVALNRPKLRKILKLPENMDLQAILALGKPKENVIWVNLQTHKGDIRYYRDERGNHYVPKRPLDEILLNLWEEFSFIKNR